MQRFKNTGRKRKILFFPFKPSVRGQKRTAFLKLNVSVGCRCNFSTLYNLYSPILRLAAHADIATGSWESKQEMAHYRTICRKCGRGIAAATLIIVQHYVKITSYFMVE